MVARTSDSLSNSTGSPSKIRSAYLVKASEPINEFTRIAKATNKQKINFFTLFMTKVQENCCER